MEEGVEKKKYPVETISELAAQMPELLEAVSKNAMRLTRLKTVENVEVYKINALTDILTVALINLQRRKKTFEQSGDIYVDIVSHIEAVIEEVQASFEPRVDLYAKYD